MPEKGYIQVRPYSSFAQIPLENVAIAVTTNDGTAIALRLTDRSGKITPIEVPTPERSESQSPGSEEAPFTSVTLRARLEGYEQIEAEHVQVFANTVTLQELEMIPLSELPDTWDETEIFDTPPQNL